MNEKNKDINWHNIEAVDAWLDKGVSTVYKTQPLAQDWARISKIAEELWEVTDAFVGMTGQNPGKGFYGAVGDLVDELADTAFTAILAIQHFTKDIEKTSNIIGQRLDHIAARINDENME